MIVFFWYNFIEVVYMARQFRSTRPVKNNKLVIISAILSAFVVTLIGFMVLYKMYPNILQNV